MDLFWFGSQTPLSCWVKKKDFLPAMWGMHILSSLSGYTWFSPSIASVRAHTQAKLIRNVSTSEIWKTEGKIRKAASFSCFWLPNSYEFKNMSILYFCRVINLSSCHVNYLQVYTSALKLVRSMVSIIVLNKLYIQIMLSYLPVCVFNRTEILINALVGWWRSCWYPLFFSLLLLF